ncbi:MAG: hypothetical protein PHI28_14865, partial [Mangrovibacterium sp.]|nr:hypothetical protein [Mangrovibacterium sp.]
RWIVFSSRRSDGFFTQLYLSYFDPDGKAHKPFLLPQKSPGFYKTFLKSYNVPELITSKIGLSPRVLSKMVRSVSENVQFEQTEQITE